MAYLDSLDVRTVYGLILAVLALAALVLGLGLIRAGRRQEQLQGRIEKALQRGKGQGVGHDTDADGGSTTLSPVVQRAAALGRKWGDGRFGDVLLAEEDRRLLEMASYPSYTHARAMFLFVRGVLSLGLPVLAVLLLPPLRVNGSAFVSVLAYGVLGFGLGWMLPKWVVRHRFGSRKRAAIEELPLLVDLLRLLQGVGLSIDQSLHQIHDEFSDVLPVLGNEIRIAVEQHALGRPRIQSLGRLIDGYDNEDFEALSRLIAQVDQHGGAVQDPLKRFGERIREQRRMELKENIGKLTVKMTGVMVATLLPALLVLTAGSGFIAVVRGLKMVGGGS